MEKDPGFVFYPGDYLRDTQCLSDKSQVAYDRIMCEHMRHTSVDMINIVVSKDKLAFFIKRLTDDEKQEVMQVLNQVGDSFQIYWVALSISKRRSYSQSRSDNRSKPNKKHMLTHETHMDNEIEDDNNTIVVPLIDKLEREKSKFKKNEQSKISEPSGESLLSRKLREAEYAVMQEQQSNL